MIQFIKRNSSILLLFGGVLLIIAISSTIAYLFKVSHEDNEFTTGIVSSNIIETFNNGVKSNVYITNSGNVNEYIRVFINVYYKDNEGTILDKIPVNSTDYRLTFSSSTNWLYNSSDNFYYYKLPIAPNTNTDVLIDECVELISDSNQILNVDIFSQAIQAEPITAVTSSWNVNITNGNVVLGGV